MAGVNKILSGLRNTRTPAYPDNPPLLSVSSSLHCTALFHLHTACHPRSAATALDTMDPSSSRQPTGDRSELLRNAVLFLTDPKVQSSTLASKIGFLESKGLTEGEIQDALRQATSSGEGTSVRAADGGGSNRGQAEFATRGYGSWSGYGTGTGYGVMPPEPPRRDWRDLFVSAKCAV